MPRKTYFALPLLLVFLFLAAVPNRCLAQEGASFGLKLSPTLVFGRQFIDDKKVDSMDVGSRLGFNGGFQAHYGFTDNFGVYSGVMISLRNLNDFIDPSLGPEGQQLNMTFVEIPAALQLTSFDLGGGWYLKGLFGATIDINTGATFKGEETLRYGDRIQPLGASFLAGAGVEYDLFGAGYLDIGLSYHHGLFNVLKTGYQTSDDERVGPISEPFADRELRLSFVALDIGFIFK